MSKIKWKEIQKKKKDKVVITKNLQETHGQKKKLSKLNWRDYLAGLK